VSVTLKVRLVEIANRQQRRDVVGLYIYIDVRLSRVLPPEWLKHNFNVTWPNVMTYPYHEQTTWLIKGRGGVMHATTGCTLPYAISTLPVL
jgi:hypothetical protein